MSNPGDHSLRSTRWTLLLTLALTIGCGGGCGGCASLDDDYIYPTRLAVDTVPVADAFRLRVTEDGIDFFEAALPAVIEGALGAEGQLVVPIPGAVIPFNQAPLVGDITIPDGQNGSPASRAIIYTEAFRDRMSVNLLDERDGIRLTIEDIQIGIELVVGAEVNIEIQSPIPGIPPLRLTSINAACLFRNGHDQPVQHALRATIDIDIFPDVNNASELDFDVNIREAALEDLDLQIDGGLAWRCDDDDLCGPFGNCVDDLIPGADNDWECDEVLCPVMNGVFNVVETLYNLLEPALRPLVNTIVQELINRLAPPTPLLSESLIDTAGLIAKLPSSARSKPLGMRLAVMPGAFTVDCANAAPGDCETDPTIGMNIATELGFEAAAYPDAEDWPAGCIRIDEDALPVFPSPQPVMLPPVWTDADGAQHRYAIGMSLAEAGMNQLTWALYGSGMICIDIDSAQIEALTGQAGLLSTGTFGLIAGEIVSIAGPNAPVLVRIRPTQAPVIDFIEGAGPTEPQVDFKMERLKLEFFIEVDRRWIRAFATLVDVGMKLQLSPERTEEDMPILVVQVAEGPTVDGFEMVYDEPVAGSDLENTLPALLDVVLGTFLSEALVFPVDLAGPLTEALGVPVDASIDHVAVRGEGGDELTLYTSMSMVEQTPHRLIQLPALTLPSQANSVQLAEGMAWVDLAVPGGAGLEFSFRVDGGPWRRWRGLNADGLLRIEQPRLALIGDHRIELRQRLEGDWNQVPQPLATLTVTTDGYRPEVHLEASEAGWNVITHDLGGLGGMRWTLAIDDEDAQSLDEPFVHREDVPPGARIQVVAIDSEGRRSRPAWVDVPRAPITDGELTAPHGGCSSMPAGLLMFVALLGLRRRRAA
ncbi:MAG: hypothetical protein CMH55_05660 [Myxococcales bacterium]|nr:hypothetical protein [Myxococcales bacterium]